MPGEAGARIEHVEVRLHGLVRLGTDYLTQSRAVAQAGEPDVPCEARLANSLQASRHRVQRGPHVYRVGIGTRQPNRIVQVEDVHVGSPEPAKARLDGPPNGRLRRAQVLRAQADLGSHHHTRPRAKLAHDSPQVLFGAPVAVLSGRIKVRDARVQCP